MLDAFAEADLNDDGSLSFSEASTVAEELTQEQFDEIDTDDDGLLSEAELEAVVEVDTGCPLGGKIMDIGALKERASDLFVFGMALITMAAMSVVGRRSTR